MKELKKLEILNEMELPARFFNGVSSRTIHKYRRRISKLLVGSRPE